MSQSLRDKTVADAMPSDHSVIISGRMYLGVDPGLSGALAFFDPRKGKLELVDMPTTAVRRNGKKRRKIDLVSLGRAVDLHTAGRSVRAYIEEVGAMPGQGVVSMFSFGRALGTVEGAVGANMIQPYYVTPRVWMGRLGLIGAESKSAHRDKAKAVFPAYAHMFARAKDDGRADASLIAFYGATTPEPAHA